jgi:hypothetical protein
VGAHLFRASSHLCHHVVFWLTGVCRDVFNQLLLLSTPFRGDKPLLCSAGPNGGILHLGSVGLGFWGPASTFRGIRRLLWLRCSLGSGQVAPIQFLVGLSDSELPGFAAAEFGKEGFMSALILCCFVTNLGVLGRGEVLIMHEEDLLPPENRLGFVVQALDANQVLGGPLNDVPGSPSLHVHPAYDFVPTWFGL